MLRSLHIASSDRQGVVCPKNVNVKQTIGIKPYKGLKQRKTSIA